MDDIKRAMKRAKFHTEEKKRAKDNSQLQDTDVFCCFHQDEVALIESLLWDVLEKDSSAPKAYNDEKRRALNALKHINGGTL